MNACIRPLFPPDTFTGDAMPDFSFLCKETDPRKGIGSMKTRIVLGNGGHVSEGMKEWALSGWYQLATFAVVRSRCCMSFRSRAPSQNGRMIGSSRSGSG